MATFIQSYMIDQGSQNYSPTGMLPFEDMVPKIMETMNETTEIAMLAAARAVVPPTAPSSLFLEFFNDDAVTRAQVAGMSRNSTYFNICWLTFQAFFNVAGGWMQAPDVFDGSATIYCGDSHLNLLGHGGGQTTFVDPAFGEEVNFQFRTLTSWLCDGTNSLTWQAGATRPSRLGQYHHDL